MMLQAQFCVDSGSTQIPAPTDAITWGAPSSSTPARIALDVTRLVAHRWTGLPATGIDRVCYAYLLHYRAEARAVVQFQGVRRIFTARHSAELFDLLLNPGKDYRRRVLMLAVRAILMGATTPPCNGAFYLNLAHTDLDRADLADWVQACNLSPIYMIHDLIPLTHAEYCTPHATKRHARRLDNALNHAMGIIANSDSTVHDIAEYSKDNGLPSIMGRWLAGATLPKGVSSIKRPDNYFVYVSTMEGRKNHFMLLQIWRQLVERMGDKAPHLMIIGQKGAQSWHVQNMLEQCEVVRKHVRVVARCPDDELGDWIAGARALLFPSFAEGFGLPLVEALELGTPVIASDIPTFHEIGQGIPTLIDPIDARTWSEVIVDFMGDCHERERQLRAMKAFRAPTWEDHLGQIDAWLERLRPSACPARPYTPSAMPINEALVSALSPVKTTA